MAHRKKLYIFFCKKISFPILGKGSKAHPVEVTKFRRPLTLPAEALTKQNGSRVSLTGNLEAREGSYGCASLAKPGDQYRLHRGKDDGRLHFAATPDELQLTNGKSTALQFPFGCNLAMRFRLIA